jgi:hypothetical protein
VLENEFEPMSFLCVRVNLGALPFLLGVVSVFACHSAQQTQSTSAQVTDTVVAHIGSHPVTIGDLSATHGQPADPQRQLDMVITRRLAAEEARRQGLAKTGDISGRLVAIHRQAQAQEEAILRDALFAKMKSELKPSEQDLRDFYEKTKIRFGARELHLRRLAFASKHDAESALAKLGLQGRLDPVSSEEIGPEVIEKLPPTVVPEALQLQQPGDRVMVQRGGESSLVELVEILPAEPRPFEDVRDQVEESLRTIRAQEAFAKEIERLRTEAKVEIDEVVLRSLTSQSASAVGQPP